MRRHNVGISVRLLAFCVVSLLVGGCARDKCAQTRMKINALASTYSASDPDGAYSECSSAVAQCPNITSAYKLMGAIDLAKKRYEGAIENYSRAFGLDPKDPEIVAAINRLSMYSVAFAGTKLTISDGKITRSPARMTDLTLREYSQLDPDVRLTWLRVSLDEVSRKTAEAMKAGNRNIEMTGTLAAYAEEVDGEILSQAEASPGGRVGDAFVKSAMNASLRHTTVGLAPR